MPHWASAIFRKLHHDSLRLLRCARNDIQRTEMSLRGAQRRGNLVPTIVAGFAKCGTGGQRIGCAALLAAGLMLLNGCATPGGTSSRRGDSVGTPDGDRTWLTVDFEPGQTLRYKFVSSRRTTLDWDPAQSNPNRIQGQFEQLEMVVACTPVEVDPYGVSTIRAICESVKATRGGGTIRRTLATDAVETARGKAFAIKVDARGKVADDAELRSLIAEMGRHAFREGGSQRIKEPDMIGDFVACLWSLWDPISSIEKPSEGVTTRQTWQSQLPVPTPMVMRKARDVTYRLDEFREADTGRLAIIRSTYTLAQTAPADWPVPYSGRFQMSGTFGFLGAYQVSGLTGEGEALFNVGAGRMENYHQQYTVEMKASLPPMGIPANPHIRIEQTLTMERVNPEIRNPNIEIRNKLE
jgi:hypothetical protein